VILNSTTTCAYSSPLTWDGDTPTNHSENFAFSAGECATLYNETSTPGVYNGFTYGEIVATTFLFFIAFLGSYAFYWFTVHRPVKP